MCEEKKNRCEEFKAKMAEIRQKKEDNYRKMDVNGKMLLNIMELGRRASFAVEKKGGQKRVLIALLENGATAQRDLLFQLGIQPGSLSELLHKLEAAELIRRTPDANDRRSAIVELTDDGRILAENALNNREAENAALFESLSAEEQETFLGLLEKLNGDWKEKYPAHGRHGFRGNGGCHRGPEGCRPPYHHMPEHRGKVDFM